MARHGAHSVPAPGHSPECLWEAQPFPQEMLVGTEVGMPSVVRIDPVPSPALPRVTTCQYSGTMAGIVVPQVPFPGAPGSVRVG